VIIASEEAYRRPVGHSGLWRFQTSPEQAEVEREAGIPRMIALEGPDIRL